MRINLDEPVPDDPALRLAETTDDETDEDADAPDGFVIRRDPLTQKRRRRAPRSLSPLELRLIAVGLIFVIAVAGVSLILYVLNVRRNADRLPITAVNRSMRTLQADQPRNGATPWGRGYRGQVAAPPDDVMQAEPGTSDRDDAPTDGIH